MNTESINGLIGNVTQKELNIAGLGMPTVIVMAVVGVLIALFGLKLIRVVSALFGLMLGAGIGACVAAGFGLGGITAVIVVLVAAVVLCGLSCGIYRFGIFVAVLVYGFWACVALIQPSEAIPSIICLVIALVCAILSVVYSEPLVVVVTAISGGLSAGGAAAVLLGMQENTIAMFGISAAVAVIGMVVQFMMQSRKVGKKEKIYSEKFKEEVSRESEVEKARMILEEDAEETDEE